MNLKSQITDISYEYSFIALSSSKRESEDNTSDVDKFEAGLIKQNEAVAIQNRVNCIETVKNIDQMFGPFSDEEVEFYRRNLMNEDGYIINNFQKQMIFNLFYKYFGDTVSIYSIDSAADYIRLMLAAKKMLESAHMIVLPYIISGKVTKLVTRKSINKKEEVKLKASSYYPAIEETYRSPRIIQQILSNIATVISSSFTIIDYNNPQIHGKQIETPPDFVMEEMLAMTLMCK